MTELTIKEINELMKRAVFDSVIYCGYCGHEPLEPDYEKCPSCRKRNPLKERGLI